MMRSMHLCAAECFRKHVEAADAHARQTARRPARGPSSAAQATVSDEMKRIQAGCSARSQDARTTLAWTRP
ncbi:hypothetical protein FNF31_07983 [Cafeteria roenbergensis]|uniref:Tim10-like domain-containing protein n=1 Tax=Cafeteria roenbergensis TaxID=33653 RepID=A0A5A8BYJ9_CAFRO|nr:hypothetical protein FNF31_07983 [Cafeteria roenbergensis]